MFVEELRALGWVEGQNIRFERRSDEGRPDRRPEIFEELVRLPVDVLVTLSNTMARAAMGATRAIPIVMVTMAFPVEGGLVTSLARPGGNLTGLSVDSGPEIDAKRLPLLKEVAPGVSRIAVLEQPRTTAARRRETEVAAQRLGLIVIREIVKDGVEIDRAVERAARIPVQAVVLTQAALFAENGARIAALALRHRLPTISGETGYAKAGGLVEYAPNIPENFRRAATYVDKILKRTRPGDLPIEQPTRVALTINLKTAKALGLTIPPSVLVRADQVIE